jgi:hypothetical protein
LLVLVTGVLKSEKKRWHAGLFYRVLKPAGKLLKMRRMKKYFIMYSQHNKSIDFTGILKYLNILIA